MDISYILNHLGEERENYFNAVSPPVIQTSNFQFKRVDDLRKAFANEKEAHIYTRGNNPTVEILRKKIAALAGAEDALIFGSGVAAIAAAVMANVKAGDHVVCVSKPYSWTKRLLTKFLPRFGVETTMIDGRNISEFEKATQPNTRLYFLETPNTFTFELQDIEAVVKLARQHNIVTVLDNSYCTSLGQRCIDMGIDIEVHSATKYYGGHSDTVAGLLIASKKMTDRVFVSELLNLGAIISPNDAWLLLRSLRTLPIRLEKIRKTTEAVVDFIKQHPMVESLLYPFDENFPQYALAKKQMQWCGGLFTVTLKVKGIEEMEVFCNSLNAFSMAVSWGGHESLIIPTCSFYPKEHYDDSVYPFNMVRFYIGLEDPEFLIEDLKQAFAKIE
ncbi:MAG: aminotransferase class I/II-fold pyridoxal phosphate-dependent enzyme [Chitinophagales bacterium]|nr:aminotransferase class I/II-fold pyridoxal phosphate-dependent enzyme [Chitinophagales bacterium]